MRLWLLCILFSPTVFGQVTYAPAFMNPCTGQVDEYASYTLETIDHQRVAKDLFDTKMNLPHFGAYYLIADFEDTLLVHITSNNQRDTFFTRTLQIPMCVCSPPPTTYEYCNQLANGYHVDYYSPGVIRCEGTFNDGYPIDTVKTYYQSGAIKELDVSFGGKKHWIRYYENGVVMRDYNQLRSTDLTYYQSGQLFSSSKKKGRYWVEKEFYPNGELSREQKKGKQVNYHQNGKRKNVATRHEEMLFYKKNFQWFTFKWKEFASSGQTSIKVRFSRGSTFRFPTSVKELVPTEVDKIVRYVNGKRSQKIVKNYVRNGTDWLYRITIYAREKHCWVEVKTDSLDAMADFIRE